MRGKRNKLPDIADLVDCDLYALLLSLGAFHSGLGPFIRSIRLKNRGDNFAEIGMIALGEPVARGAGAAGNAALIGIFAEQRLRQGARKFDLADTFPAMNQAGMWELSPALQHVTQGSNVPTKNFNGHIRSMILSSSLRILSNSSAELMTLILCG